MVAITIIFAFEELPSSPPPAITVFKFLISVMFKKFISLKPTLFSGCTLLYAAGFSAISFVYLAKYSKLI